MLPVLRKACPATPIIFDTVDVQFIRESRSALALCCDKHAQLPPAPVLLCCYIPHMMGLHQHVNGLCRVDVVFITFHLEQSLVKACESQSHK